MLRWLKCFVLSMIILPLFYILSTSGVDGMVRFMTENPISSIVVLEVVGSAILASFIWYGTKRS